MDNIHFSSLNTDFENYMLAYCPPCPARTLGSDNDFCVNAFKENANSWFNMYQRSTIWFENNGISSRVPK